MIRQQAFEFDPVVLKMGDFSTGRLDVYGALAGQAIEESVTGFVWRAAGRKLGALTGTAGDLLDIGTANDQFGVDGLLAFDKPVYADHAKQLYEIKQRELVRGSIIEAGNTGMFENLAVSLAASLIDPIGDAVAFVPYVGTSIKAAHIARAGGKAMTLGRRMGVGAAEGFAAGLSQELVIMPLAIYGEKRDYGAEDMMLTLVLSSGLGALARGADLGGKHRAELAATDGATGASRDLALTSPVTENLGIDGNDIVPRPGADLVAGPDVPDATKQAAFRSAVKQVANGEPVTAADVLEAGRLGRMNAQLGETGPAIRARAIKADIAYDAKGGETYVEYALVELDDLITSHRSGFMVNQQYPSVLQPRDRSSGAYQAQVREIAAKLKPELLGENPLASDGAPVIAPDGVVESGNGRTLALRMARSDGLGGWKSYQEYLAAQGYPVGDMDAPVLVRIAQGERTPEERVKFGQDANEDGKADFAVTERARIDGDRLDDSVLDVELKGELSSAGNRDFVTGILNTISSASDLPKLIDKSGAISADGLRRVKAALAAKAYDDPYLLTDILESTSPGARAINTALVEIAPKWANMRALAKKGDIDGDMDITQELLNAVTLIRRMRDIKAKGEKVTLAELEAETNGDLFGEARGATERMMLNMFYGPDSKGNPLIKALSKEAVQTRLNAYIDIALTTKGGPNLFGANKLGESDAPAQRPKDILTQITGQDVPEGFADIRAAPGTAPRQGGAGDGQGVGDVRAETGRQSGVSARQGDPESPGGTPDAAGRDSTELAKKTGVADGVTNDPKRFDELSEIEAENAVLAGEIENLVEGGMLDEGVLADLVAEYDPEKLTAFKKGLRAAVICVVKGGGS